MRGLIKLTRRYYRKRAGKPRFININQKFEQTFTDPLPKTLELKYQPGNLKLKQ